MDKSKIFIKGYETPFDRHVKPVYQEFLKLQAEIVHNWKTEFIQGKIGERNFRDLRDVRLQIGKNGDAVIKLTPEIGFDTEEEIAFYLRFFRTYIRIKNEIFSHLIRYEIGSRYLNQYPGAEDTLKAHKEEWYAIFRPRVYLLIMSLKVMIMAKAFGKLRDEDLKAFDMDQFSHQNDFIAAIDDLVREYDLPTMEAKMFTDRGHHFHEVGLDTELVFNCVKHAQRVAGKADHPLIKKSLSL